MFFRIHYTQIYDLPRGSSCVIEDQIEEKKSIHIDHMKTVSHRTHLIHHTPVLCGVRYDVVQGTAFVNIVFHIFHRRMASLPRKYFASKPTELHWEIIAPITVCFRRCFTRYSFRVNFVSQI